MALREPTDRMAIRGVQALPRKREMSTLAYKATAECRSELARGIGTVVDFFLQGSKLKRRPPCLISVSWADRVSPPARAMTSQRCRRDAPLHRRLRHGGHVRPFDVLHESERASS